MAEANDPLATVQRIFSAFGAGDLDALIETVHPDSHWTYYGANPKPSKAEFVGKARVRRFFEGILARTEMTAFNTNEFIVHGDTVVIFGSESGKMKATGQPFHNEWTQKYVVKDNRITNMVEYNIQLEPRN
jgi:ketosteroid isomerase-like protein